jgi:hypothetical protein
MDRRSATGVAPLALWARSLILCLHSSSAALLRCLFGATVVEGRRGQ